jgi:virginiamycin B lyase
LPYGIAVNSKGVPVFAEFGSDKLASIDPATMTIHEYALPKEPTAADRDHHR